MEQRWRLALDGHDYAVAVDPERSVVELRIDDHPVAEQPIGPLRHRFALSDADGSARSDAEGSDADGSDRERSDGAGPASSHVIVRTWGRPAIRHASLRRGSPRSVPSLPGTALPAPSRRHGEVIDFEPPAGTPARRRYDWKRRHAGLYASRHVVLASARVLLALIGIGFLFRWLPSLDWPELPLPDLSLPSLPWPDVDWPDLPLPAITLPGWIQALLRSRNSWLPIVIAVVVARREVRRRRQREASAAAGSPTPVADREHEGDGAHR